MSMHKDTAEDTIELVNQINYSYIIYQSEDKVLTNNNRRNAIFEYLYTPKKVHMVYILRKEDVESKKLSIHVGWASKIDDMDGDSTGTNILEGDEFVELFQYENIIKMLVKIPLTRDDSYKYDKEVIYDVFSSKLKFLEENQYNLAGDIMGIKVANELQGDVEVEYIEFYIPILNRCIK